jgi:endonuclease YncB( thermonuclease family)
MFMSVVSHLVLATAAKAIGPSATAPEACKLPGLGTATVASVRDGCTLLLTDGRELRLAAIEADDASRAALNTLAADKVLRLKRLGPEQEHYGRVVAIAYTDDAHESLQQVMLAQGEARVSARVGNRPCAELLLKAARAAARGFWAQFCPFAVTRYYQHYGCSGSVRPYRGQGLVGAGERRHNIC